LPRRKDEKRLEKLERIEDSDARKERGKGGNEHFY